MKAVCLLLLSGFVLNLCAQNQNPNGAPTSPPSINSAAVEISPYAVTQRGPHDRVWQNVVAISNSLGNVTYRTNSYTELATGLCYWNGSQWMDSSDQIQLTANGATASSAQNQVSFAANINTGGAVSLTMPDGQQMASHVMGLAYIDSNTGSNVLFAETQDSIGQLLPLRQSNHLHERLRPRELRHSLPSYLGWAGAGHRYPAAIAVASVFRPERQQHLAASVDGILLRTKSSDHWHRRRR